MIIDAHVHVLPPRVRNNRDRYVEKDTAFASIYKEAKAAIATTEDLLQTMDREGINLSVIVNYSWTTPGLCRETNDYILESCAKHPDRLAGFCAVPDFSSEFSLNELQRCADAGAKGIGEMRPDFWRSEFISRDIMQPFMEVVQENKLPLLLHATEPLGHQYPGKGEATPSLIYRFLANFPDTPVICAHWGGGLPFYSLMPEVRKIFQNVYFDTAASPFLYLPDIYPAVIHLVGAEKILFGSDYPVMSPSRIVNEINTAGISDQERELLLSKNARRLLGT